jgi:hypothetical protein
VEDGTSRQPTEDLDPSGAGEDANNPQLNVLFFMLAVAASACGMALLVLGVLIAQGGFGK